MCFGIRISSPFHLATLILPIENHKYPKNAKNACADALHNALKGGGFRKIFDFGKNNKAIMFLWLNRILPPSATFWGPWGPKQVTLDVFDNVQPCSINVQPIWSRWRCLWLKMAIIGKIWPFFGQKWGKNAEIWWARGWTILCLTKETRWLY